VFAAIAGIVAHANYLIGRFETDDIATHAPGRFLTIEGRQQHFVTVGDIHMDATGAPILLIHGFIISGHAELMPWAADKLAPARSLILPDLMGYGHSQREPTAGEWSAPKAHARYLAQLLDQLGIDKVDLVGHSYGGALAARFALDYPQRVRKIVYLNPGLYMPKTRAEAIIEAPLGIGRALTYHFLGNGPYGFPGRLCPREQVHDCAAAFPARIKDTTETLRAMIYTNRHTPVLEELYAGVPRLTTPGMVLWGQNDIFLPLENGERFARESHSQIVVLPGASHLSWREKPDEVATRVLSFLQP
jgi:pimeloyl-ACP methyl ester carboxylesterase